LTAHSQRSSITELMCTQFFHEEGGITIKMYDEEQSVALTDAERSALRGNAARILRESRIASVMQEMNKALLKGRGWFDEYDSGVIMKWGTGYTRRHLWVHIDDDQVRIRLLQHRRCDPASIVGACDGEYHSWGPDIWSDLDVIKDQLKYYYDHPVAESSDD